jgi:hypothetical protein
MSVMFIGCLRRDTAHIALCGGKPLFVARLALRPTTGPLLLESKQAMVSFFPCQGKECYVRV